VEVSEIGREASLSRDGPNSEPDSIANNECVLLRQIHAGANLTFRFVKKLSDAIR